MTATQKWLQAHATFRSEYMPSPDGWKYGSYEELLLDRGRTFTLCDLPPELDRGAPKECYRNATEGVFRTRQLDDGTKLFYCEGYGPSLFPVAHAFIVTEDGRAFDPTWDPALFDGSDRDGDYFGIAYDADWYLNHLLETNEYGVFAGELHPVEYLRDGLPDGATADWTR